MSTKNKILRATYYFQIKYQYLWDKNLSIIGMKFMKSTLRVSFFLLCLAITGYLVYLQFLYFMKNEDVASISHRTLNAKEKDEYPIFTICFRSIYLNTIFEKDLFNNTGITPESYQKYLSGLLQNVTNIFGEINYDEVVFDIESNGLINFLTSNSVKGNQTLYEMMALTTTFKDQFSICYSKNISFRRNVRYTMDYVNLNTALLHKRFFRMDVYIHKKGQLLRSLHKQIAQIIPSEYKSGMRYEFVIKKVEILRGRRDSNIPCNENLTNEDAYVLALIMKMSKCVPAYWNSFASSFVLNRELERCAANQYLNVQEKFTYIVNGFHTPNSFYIHPCENMNVLVTKMEKNMVNPDEGEFYFKYDQDSYKEIVNIKAYSFETLVGQVGGYVGMCHSIQTHE